MDRGLRVVLLDALEDLVGVHDVLSIGELDGWDGPCSSGWIGGNMRLKSGLDVGVLEPFGLVVNSLEVQEESSLPWVERPSTDRISAWEIKEDVLLR